MLATLDLIWNTFSFVPLSRRGPRYLRSVGPGANV
jgi:hypothetical protein